MSSTDSSRDSEHDRHTQAGRSPSPLRRDQRLDSDVLLQRTLQGLLGRANHRQVWAFFLDAEHRIVDPIVPFEDLPEDPLRIFDTEDLGTIPFARVLRHRVAQVAEMISATSLVLVWERRGGESFAPRDLEWARQLSASTPDTGIRIRAQFLLHDAGLRQLAADDYV